MNSLEEVILKKIEMERKALDNPTMSNLMRRSTEIWIKTVSSGPYDAQVLKDRISLVRTELDKSQEMPQMDVLATELVALKWLLWVVSETNLRPVDRTRA